MNLHEVAVIDNGIDDFVHVVGFVRVCRNDVVQIIVHAGDIIRTLYERSLLHIVLRDERNETTYLCQRLFLRSSYEMGNAGLGSVNLGATELLHGNVLTCNGFDYLRAGDEHIAVLLGHHDEVGQRRAIYCSTRARAENNRYLRHNAGSENVTFKNLCVTCERASTFLNTCATRVIQTDDRCAEFHSLVHDVANLKRHRLAQRTADDGSVLREHEHQTAVDSTGTDCHTIAEEHFLLHAEVMATMGKEHVHFLEGTFVEQHVNTLTAGVTALGVMFLNGCFTAAGHCLLAVCNQFI